MELLLQLFIMLHCKNVTLL
ncbi:hypothetical protein M6B38_221195 [Iris pallida]|uniref:Uncharacterized protein n=1 Tax=Iris pallida TaxID=29817 RepID=A0AAX6DYX3_IRIPA|nr:hypothetical protein M6B38_221195 [Iris pallida]